MPSETVSTGSPDPDCESSAGNRLSVHPMYVQGGPSTRDRFARQRNHHRSGAIVARREPFYCTQLFHLILPLFSSCYQKAF